MAEAKTLGLLALRGFGLPSELAPRSAIEPCEALLELAQPADILFPPGHVAQQIAVPVLAAADAAILRLESANAA